MDPGFILFVVAVVVIIVGIGFAPLFYLKNKADGLGAEISWMQSFQLFSRQSTDKEFLKAIALDQENNLDVGITHLETHLLAGGDPYVVMQSILLARKLGMDFDFGQLSSIQLAGQDPVEAVNRTKEISDLKIISFNVNRFEFDYHAQYRIGIGGIFGDPNQEDIEHKIKDRLELFTQNWPSRDTSITQDFLLKNILNAEYWEKVIGAQLIQQYLEVKRV